MATFIALIFSIILVLAGFRAIARREVEFSWRMFRSSRTARGDERGDGSGFQLSLPITGFSAQLVGVLMICAGVVFFLKHVLK